MDKLDKTLQKLLNQLNQDDPYEYVAYTEAVYILHQLAQVLHVDLNELNSDIITRCYGTVRNNRKSA